MEDTTRIRIEILRELMQPMTSAQIARKLKIPTDRCNYAVRQLSNAWKLVCLNPAACRSRLYWLTPAGITEQQELRQEAGLPPAKHDFPDVDWKKYGDVCFEHRSIVVRTLREPMQPAQIKRRALLNDSTIRFSANNCRDVVRFLKAAELLRPVQYKRKKHLRYELTEEGQHFQRLLKLAEERPL